MADTFSHSCDGEYFYGHEPTRAAALEAGRNEYGLDRRIYTIYTAKNQKAGPYGVNLADWIIDKLKDEASDQCGEFAEDFLSCTTVTQLDDLNKRIAAAVDEWLTAQKLRPTFFAVSDVQEHGYVVV